MEDLIEKTYIKAVEGINQELLDDSYTWYKYVVELPVSQQVVYTTILLHSQVENGGFHQYFFNSYGQFAYVTLKNLNLIGAKNRAILLKKALFEVNKEGFDESFFRKLIFSRSLKRLVNFDKDLLDYLNVLDDQYYKLENEDIYDLLEEYLNSNL